MLCSENYIFGKFDTFCKRLNKIVQMITLMDQYAGLADVKIEGIDALVVRYKTIVEAMKKKTYDFLDHRKTEVWIVSFYPTPIAMLISSIYIIFLLCSV